jgi:monoterpene epsilon-lactone hydrolase
VSLQAKIVQRLLRFQFSGWSQGSIEEQRARHEKSTRFNRLPTDVLCQHVSADGVAAEWIAAPDADWGVMLYLHGGAYVLGSINTCRELVARLARAARMRGLAINYRLAPEHPFPAALEDATTAYEWLLAKGVEPSRIIIAGDSAGGGLALAALVALRNARKPLPAGAVCLSPWTDLALGGASIQRKAQVDCILDADSLEMYAKLYAGERDRSSPLISPLFADLSGLPPLLIQVGTDEVLLDDATRCADRARQAGVDVTLEIWDEMFHVFQLLPFLPEAKEAVGRIAEFVSQNLNRSDLI